MKRLALLILLLLAACSRPQADGVTELTFATPYQPSHPFSRADQRWMDYVKEKSGGRLVIRPSWSGSLLSSDMSMEELRHGVADIGLITPIYSKGGTHLIRIQSGFYRGAVDMPSQLRLYRCIEAAEPEMDRELAGLKILAVQGGSLPGIITANRPVRRLEDLKGMRIRAPTELLKVLESLGADPVNMPMGEVYSAMAKGVIDGVIAPWDTFRSLHFAEVAKYYSTIEVPRGAYPSRAISEKRWNRLTDAERQLLRDSVAVWEAALAEEVEKAMHAGRQEATKAGVVVYAMPATDQRRFDATYLRDSEENARDLARFGIDGMPAFRAARAAVKGRGEIGCEGTEA